MQTGTFIPTLCECIDKIEHTSIKFQFNVGAKHELFDVEDANVCDETIKPNASLCGALAF